MCYIKDNWVFNPNALQLMPWLKLQRIRFVHRKLTCCLLLDNNKAFDTIDHSKFLQKPSEDGVRGIALKWFKSFVTIVEISDWLSQVEFIMFCAPQGSLFWPVLFVLGIKDLPLRCEQLNQYMFADDTHLLYVSNLINTYALNEELNQIASWFAENGCVWILLGHRR